MKIARYTRTYRQGDFEIEIERNEDAEHFKDCVSIRNWRDDEHITTFYSLIEAQNFVEALEEAIDEEARTVNA